MKMHALRLSPGDDVLLEIERYCQTKNIAIGVILSAVGDVSEAKLLNSNTRDSSRVKEPMEITGISGTVSSSRTHLHITLARKSYSIIGGHLPHGCYVGKSVEIVIGEFTRNETMYDMSDEDIYKNPTEKPVDEPFEEIFDEEEDISSPHKKNAVEYDSLVTNLFKNNKTEDVTP